MNIPIRPRRLRKGAATRELVQETWVRREDLIQPLFVIDGEGVEQTVGSMPGVSRYSIDNLVKKVDALVSQGIGSFALFPNTEASLKDATGSEALNADNLVCRAIRAVRAEFPEVNLFADVALDPYTTHGHDGLLNEAGNTVLNDETVEVLVDMALNLAHAGADWIAPSDMMDGRVAMIREALESAGLTETCILAYSAKYASAFYGPFRDAVGSAKAAGTPSLDKATYQMNPANRREAILEAQLDLEEGADAIMVKPAGPYLDIIRDLREAFNAPLAAYQVSGEYAQIHAAAQNGWLDLEKCALESLLAIKRAGADMILTYFADWFSKR